MIHDLFFRDITQDSIKAAELQKGLDDLGADNVIASGISYVYSYMFWFYISYVYMYLYVTCFICTGICFLGTKRRRGGDRPNYSAPTYKFTQSDEELSESEEEPPSDEGDSDFSAAADDSE